MKCSLCDREYFTSQVHDNAVCGSCVLKKQNNTKSREVKDIVQEVIRNSLVPAARTEVQYPMLKLKSNFARNVAVLIDSVHIQFDKDGVGSVPAQYRPIIEREMAFKPGRYLFLEDVKPQEVVAVQAPAQETLVELDILVGEEPVPADWVELDIVVGEEPVDSKKSKKKRK